MTRSGCVLRLVGIAAAAVCCAGLALAGVPASAGGVERPSGSLSAATRAGAADTTPPVTAISGAGGWHNRAVTITFVATDEKGGSGMAGGSARTQYQLDAGAWTTGTALTLAAPADHTMDGLHALSYHSIDAAGNSEAVRTAAVGIDTMAPEGSFVLAGGAAQTGSLEVTLTADVSDAHGPLEQRFSSDGQATWSAWAAYAASSTVTVPAGNGAKTVIGQYRDAAGNVLVASDDIELVAADLTAPVVTVAGAVAGGWYRAPVVLQLTATDSGGSGMAFVTYKLGGLQQTYPGGRAVLTVRSAPSGTRTLTYYAGDLAGNVSARRTLSFKMDVRGPSTAARAARGRAQRPLVLRYRVTDNLSPSATVSLVIKDDRGRRIRVIGPRAKVAVETWQSARWTPPRKGVYRCFVTATDLAGNPQRDTGSATLVVQAAAKQKDKAGR